MISQAALQTLDAHSAKHPGLAPLISQIRGNYKEK
jgi:hypothetical protein